MNNQKGFTLVEIIVTVVILAVLMAVAVPVSMSYFDDVNEKRILNEGQNVLAVARNRVNKLSLGGSYNEVDIASTNDTHSYTSSQRQEIVDKASGSGILTELVYFNSDVTRMRYYIDNVFVVWDGKELRIDKDFHIDNVIEVMAGSGSIMNEIKNFFNGHSEIDSEAPTAAEANLNGVGSRIRTFLLNQGMDIDNLSWTILKTNNQSYEFLICDKKITKNDEGKTLTAYSYIFAPDGTISTDGYASQVSVKVQKSTEGNYYVMRK